MSGETKAPTKEDVERWKRKLVKGLDFEPTELTCLYDAALLGAQVPGLEEQVSALQARVAELEGEWKRLNEAAVAMSRTVDKVMEQRDEARAERDALRAQVAQLQRSAGDLQVERNRASHYNDVLRQRFDTARNDALEEAAARIDMEAQESHTRETASLLDDVAKRVRDLKRAALSASPAETKKAPIGDAAWCAHAAAREGDLEVAVGSPVETPATEREEGEP